MASFGENYDKQDFLYSSPAGFYLRVIPSSSPSSKRFARSDLLAKVRGAGLRPFADNTSAMISANSWGAASVDADPAALEIRQLSQVFATGECWGLNRSFLRDINGNKAVPVLAFEKGVRKTLAHYLDVMTNHLGLSFPFKVKAGAVGLMGFSLYYGNNSDPAGPIYDDEFNVELVLNSVESSAIDEICRRFFEELFYVAGVSRPALL